ncbi:MAG: TolC family protein, partial [Muribaculaceae bacterium]
GGIKIEQPIFMGGKIRAGYNIAKTARNLYEQNRRLTEADIIVNTAKAYADLLRATQMQQVALSYKTLLTELQNDVEKAFKHGLKPKNDVLKVKVKHNEAILNLRKAENACRLASMNLCHYIGRPLTDSISVNPDAMRMQVMAQWTYDYSNRPETQIQQYKTDIARQKVAVARADYLPQIGIVGQYGYLNGIKLGSKKVFDNDAFMIGVQVSIPIYDFGHKTGKIRSAQEQLAAAKAEQEDTDRLLSLSLNQAINNLDEAYLEIELAKSTVYAADENLRSSTKQYQAGMESLSDNLEAQTLWQQAHATLIEAHATLFLRTIEYLRANGTIN